MSPRVSILIITYNQAAYVEETVRSALAQSYEPLEVVVADDHSTDETPDILRRLAATNPKLRLVLGERNLGITGNSNRGLRACRGEMIAFQGGDDLLLPGKIAAQVEWMTGRAQRVLCGHDVEYFASETGDTLSIHAPRRCGLGPRDVIRAGPPYAATAVMIRASAAPARGFDERLPRVSDWKLWIDVLESGGEFGRVDGVFARYRIHDKNITRVAARECFIEQFLTLAYVEAESPHRARDCRHGRAFLLYREGVAALQAGRSAEASRLISSSLAESWTHSTRAPLWLALARAPRFIRERIVGTARS